MFQLIKSFQPHCDPGVDSASKRNEFQEFPWGEKGDGRVRLTTSQPSVSRLSRKNVGASTSHKPMDLHSLLQGWFYLFCTVRVQASIITVRDITLSILWYKQNNCIVLIVKSTEKWMWALRCGSPRSNESEPRLFDLQPVFGKTMRPKPETELHMVLRFHIISRLWWG
jgi:hypothetical protein